jgi:peptidoglycan/xylan/chitin deacetylase (PgdA/CDA1 family)
MLAVRRCRTIGAVLVGLAVLAGCASGGDPGVAPFGALPAAVAGPSTSAPAISPHELPGYRTDATVPVVITHGAAGGHRIALTFDSNMTDAMLRRLDTGQVASYANTAVVDELQARHTPATFFLAGKWVERYPDLTRRIAADPDFEIASHSYAHRGFAANCYRLDPEPTTDMAADVEHSFTVLAPFGGRQTRYFRFPGGCYDTAALRAIAATHATVIQYDDVADDPFNDDTTAITNGVLRQAHDGAIVVLHITQANAPRTADALPAIIDGLRARGYRLVDLSDLLTARPGG